MPKTGSLAAIVTAFVVTALIAQAGPSQADDDNNVLAHRVVRSGMNTKLPTIDILVYSDKVLQDLPILQAMQILNPTMTVADFANHIHRTLMAYCITATQAALNNSWQDTKASKIDVRCRGQYGDETQGIFDATFPRSTAKRMEQGMDVMDFMKAGKPFSFSPEFTPD